MVKDRCVINLGETTLGYDSYYFETSLRSRSAFAQKSWWQDQDAISGLPVDVVEKVAVQFNANAFKVGQNNALATPLVDTVDNSLVQAQFLEKKVGICIIVGGIARNLDAAGCPALIDYAPVRMESMFGSSVSETVLRGRSSWSSDPYSRGAYTYATPGAVPLRTALAAPAGNQIFFAGEALSIEHRFLIESTEASKHSGVAL